MENASKALIIAGAILISILLISVGIIIMNAINDPVQQGANAASSQGIDMFNSKFTAYDGKIKGSVLKGLVTTINSSNVADESHTVTLTADSGLSINSTSDIKPSTNYDVEVKYSTGSQPNDHKLTTSSKVLAGKESSGVKSENGYIYEIHIKRVSGTNDYIGI